VAESHLSNIRKQPDAFTVFVELDAGSSGQVAGRPPRNTFKRGAHQALDSAHKRSWTGCSGCAGIHSRIPKWSPYAALAAFRW
jgi:hypothetical protein